MVIFLVADRWGDFVEWLEGHEPAAQVFVALAALLVTAALVFITFRYAKSAATHAATSVVMAEETSRLAQATKEMVDATLCPVIEQRVGTDRLGDNRMVRVVYKNTGNGPAVNIGWYLRYRDGREWDGNRRRVGMSIREPEGTVILHVDESPDGSLPVVVAEYESVFGVLWRSTLPVIEEDGRLGNGEPEIKRIAERRQP